MEYYVACIFIDIRSTKTVNRRETKAKLSREFKVVQIPRIK